MAAKIQTALGVAQAAPSDPAGVGLFLSYFVSALQNSWANLANRVNNVLPTDGSEAMTGTLPLAVYTTATLPAASAANKGHVAYVSDGGSGNVFQGSNGTAWVGLG